MIYYDIRTLYFLENIFLVSVYSCNTRWQLRIFDFEFIKSSIFGYLISCFNLEDITCDFHLYCSSHVCKASKLCFANLRFVLKWWYAIIASRFEIFTLVRSLGLEYVLARNPGLNVLLSVKEGWGVLCNNQKEFRVRPLWTKHEILFFYWWILRLK